MSLSGFCRVSTTTPTSLRGPKGTTTLTPALSALSWVYVKSWRSGTGTATWIKAIAKVLPYLTIVTARNALTKLLMLKLIILRLLADLYVTANCAANS